MRKIYNRFSHISGKIRKTALAAAILLGTSSLATAQVSTYSFTQSNGVYSEVNGTVLGTATGTTSATNLNSELYQVPLPFAFVFNGVNYSAGTNINMSSNGFITFGATAPTATTISPISSTTAYDGAVSAFGGDLSSYFIAGKRGDMSYDVVGTAPNRELVMQWRNFRPNNSTSTTVAYTFSFQIRLRETSYTIATVYDAGTYLVGSTSISGTRQIGLRGSSNTDFNNRLNPSTVSFNASTDGTANNSSQAYHTVNATPGMPAAGLTYTWTPASCYAPTAITATAQSSTSIQLDWTPPVLSPPANYTIYYSTSNTAPTATTVLNSTNSVTTTGTTYTFNSLNPATSYFFWVRSDCGASDVSQWSGMSAVATLCVPPNITVTGETVCPGASATLSAASTTTGTTINWYDAATGGNLLATGATFTTPPLTATTNYYATSSTGSTATVGAANPAIGAGGYTNLETYRIFFTANSQVTISSVDIYPNSSAVGNTVQIGVYTASGTLVQSVPHVIVNGGDLSTPETVQLNIMVSPGDYYMKMIAGASQSIYRNTAGSSFPYSIPELSLTGHSFSGYPQYYYYFYNWQISTKCESPRTLVTATVDSACMSTNETEAADTLLIYPNPFKDVLNFAKAKEISSVMITDMSGRTLKKFDKVSETLNFSDLKTGTYIVTMKMKNGDARSVKVIKK